MKEIIWNQFGINEIVLICFAAIGLMSVIFVITIASINNDEIEKKQKSKKLQSLDPDERVLADK